MAVTPGAGYADDGVIAVSVTDPEQNGAAAARAILSALAVDDVTGLTVGEDTYTVDEMKSDTAELILGAVSSTTLTGLLGADYGDASHTLELHLSTLASNEETYSYTKTFTLTFHMDEQAAQDAADAAAQALDEAVKTALGAIQGGDGYTVSLNGRTMTVDITKPVSSATSLVSALESAFTQADTTPWEQSAATLADFFDSDTDNADKTYTINFSGSVYGVDYCQTYTVSFQQNADKVDTAITNLLSKIRGWGNGQNNPSLRLRMDENSNEFRMEIADKNATFLSGATGCGLKTVLLGASNFHEAYSLEIQNADGSESAPIPLLKKLSDGCVWANHYSGVFDFLKYIKTVEDMWGISSSGKLGEALTPEPRQGRVVYHARTSDGICYTVTVIFRFVDATIAE